MESEFHYNGYGSRGQQKVCYSSGALQYFPFLCYPNTADSRKWLLLALEVSSSNVFNSLNSCVCGNTWANLSSSEVFRYTDKVRLRFSLL